MQTKEKFMDKIIAVFRSRTDVMTFVDDMKKNSAYAITIQTPSQANVGCGISAEFSKHYIGIATRIVKFRGYPSFYGFFYEEKGRVMPLSKRF